jgi:hypothetical protein
VLTYFSAMGIPASITLLYWTNFLSKSKHRSGDPIHQL